MVLNANAIQVVLLECVIQYHLTHSTYIVFFYKCLKVILLTSYHTRKSENDALSTKESGLAVIKGLIQHILVDYFFNTEIHLHFLW